MNFNEIFVANPNVFAIFQLSYFAGLLNSVSMTILFVIVFLCTIFGLLLVRLKTKVFKTYSVIPAIFFGLYQYFYSGTLELAGRKGSRIFGLCLTIFIFLVTLNVIGLLLLSFTVMSQLSTTFWFSLTIFFSCILLGVINKNYNFKLLN